MGKAPPPHESGSTNGDPRPEKGAQDLKVIGIVRLLGPDQPGAAELHKRQVKVIGNLLRRLALEGRSQGDSD
jgi:hypothetical protein